MRLHLVRQRPSTDSATPGPAPDPATHQSRPPGRRSAGGPRSGLGDRSRISDHRPPPLHPIRQSPAVGRWSGTGVHRPTPLESGLAAVARHDVHIERVWPMRSPSTGSLEESSSAYFQRERRGTPPASIVPVEGLQMSQAFAHEPVMATEVVELFSPVPPGLIVDATLGGGGHAAALLEAHPGITLLGHRPGPAGRGRGHRRAGPLRQPGHHPSVPVRRPGPGGPRRA